MEDARHEEREREVFTAAAPLAGAERAALLGRECGGFASSPAGFSQWSRM